MKSANKLTTKAAKLSAKPSADAVKKEKTINKSFTLTDKQHKHLASTAMKMTIANDDGKIVSVSKALQTLIDADIAKGE